MLTFTRRGFVLTAASAAAAFGLDGRLEIIPSAHAREGTGPSPMNPKGLTHARFKVGDIEVTQIFDGAVVRDHNAAFIKNASVDNAKAALKKAGIPDDKMPNTYTITVLKIGDKYVMFDSGNGFAGRPKTGLLDDGLKAAGIDKAKISTIIVTHFHPDHISGLIAKDHAQVYGNIEIVVGAAEYKYWTDPGVIAKLPPGRQGLAKRIQEVFPKWKNLRHVEPDKEVLPGVRSVSTFGHSPGHMSYHLASGGQQLMVLGDVTNIPAINMANPGWHIAFDQDAKQAEAIRRKTFDRAVADKIVCTGYHWGMPGAGTIAKDGNGYALVPAAV